jgi:hypothetical protein
VIFETAAMATLIHNVSNIGEETTFTQNRQSAPPYKIKTTVDDIRRLSPIIRAALARSEVRGKQILLLFFRDVLFNGILT